MVSGVSSPPLTSVAAKPSPMVDIRGLTSKNSGANQPTSPVNDVNSGATTGTTIPSAPTTNINNSSGGVKASDVGAGQGKFNSGNNVDAPVTTTPSAPTATPTVVPAVAPTSGGGAMSGAGDDGVNVVSINRVLDEEATVISTTTTSGSGPKTYANLFKSSSTASTVTTTVPQTQVSKSGANGPSPGSNVVILFYIFIEFTQYKT